jgi:hypothetical protein
LTSDFKEFLSLLNSEKIDYLLIGGYAVGLYGHVRPTKDIDLWVSVAPENLDRLVEVLVKFGFARQSIRKPLFSGEQTVLRMGVPPNRLEVLSEIAGLNFADCHARRVMMEIEGLQVPVISLDDLRANKLATGRARDAADVEALDKRRPRPD